MKKVFVILALLVAALVAWLLLRPATPAPVVALPPAAPASDVPLDWMTPASQPPAEAGDAEAAPGEYDDVPLHDDAIDSLRGARILGYDPRTPPIARSLPQEQATPEEIADPEKYAEFEARQDRKLKRAYVIEAEKYVSQLKDDIERGKAMGIPPEKIAKVREKVRRIEAMRAQLLAEDPALLDAGSAVPKKPAQGGGLPQLRPEGPLGTALKDSP